VVHRQGPTAEDGADQRIAGADFSLIGSVYGEFQKVIQINNFNFI
jgi:hypothetical protein